MKGNMAVGWPADRLSYTLKDNFYFCVESMLYPASKPVVHPPDLYLHVVVMRNAATVIGPLISFEFPPTPFNPASNPVDLNIMALFFASFLSMQWGFCFETLILLSTAELTHFSENSREVSWFRICFQTTFCPSYFWFVILAVENGTHVL